MSHFVSYYDQNGELEQLVCDGIEDEIQIQYALNNLQSSGGEILLSSGEFMIDSPIYINKNNTSVRGSGQSTVIKANYNDIDMLVVGDGVETINDISIGNLKIDSLQLKVSGTGIKVQKGFKIWIKDVHVAYQYRAIHLINTTQVWLDNMPFRNTKENGITIEADLNSGYDYYFNNLVMDNPDIVNNGVGILWLGGENLQISGGDIIHFVTGLSIDPPQSKEARWAFISNLNLDTHSNNGIYLGNAGTGNLAGINFSNTWTGSNGNYGVLIDRNGSGYVQGVRFVGHKSMNNGLAGFRFAGGVDIHISDSDIISNSAAVHGSRSGVEIAENVSDWSVNHCRIGNGYGHGESQKDGVHIDIGDTNNYAIIGNDLRDNTGNPITNGGIGSNYVIDNNLI